MRGHPGNRRADRMQVLLLAERHVFLRDLEHPFVAVACLVHLVGLEPSRCLAEVLAREQARRRRTVGNEPMPLASAIGRISTSACRFTRLYIGWTTCSRAQLWRSCRSTARCVCHAAQLLTAG